MAREHTRTLGKARAEAGQDALAGSYVMRSGAPKFIHDWQAGRDKATYSQDDVAQLDNPGATAQGIAQHARPGDLAGYVPNNAVSAAADAGGVLADFYFVHGRDESGDIPLYPIIRSVVYGADAIQMQANAWLTWTHIE
ncbi:MAG: hypothetical protein NTV49_05495 [Kiritimatiellaeota bacterium]|nr:hypothetical protein [Kiritimatiellota bacterium]